MKGSDGVFLAAVLLVLTCPVKAAATTGYLLASPGWQLEYFGRDVVILRTALVDRSSRRTGQIMLSCDAAERRLRIILPERASGFGAGVSDGSALLRIGGAVGSGQPAIVARFSIQDDRVLTFAGTGAANGDAALKLAQLLRANPARLEILAHGGRSPVALRSIQPYVLAFAFDRNDAIGFDGFIATCSGKS